MTKLYKNLKMMFGEMDVKKKASVIPTYYHKDFILYCNGEVQNYEEFLKAKQEYYQTDREYIFEYDDSAVVENDNMISVRMWITVELPGEKAKKFEVMVITEYKDGKIYRMYELSNSN